MDIPKLKMSLALERGQEFYDRVLHCLDEAGFEWEHYNDMDAKHPDWSEFIFIHLNHYAVVVDVCLNAQSDGEKIGEKMFNIYDNLGDAYDDLSMGLRLFKEAYTVLVSEYNKNYKEEE